MSNVGERIIMHLCELCKAAGRHWVSPSFEMDHGEIPFYVKDAIAAHMRSVHPDWVAEQGFDQERS